jgi:diadenosine tetraphosphate (Ap4A) HIT family hydrolase
MEDCIFCRIVRGEEPCHKIWEDEKHLAFLGIYPNTEGMSIVIPKKHYSSYAFDLPDDVLKDLIVASKKASKLLDNSFEDVGRTGMVFEGFGVDHVHAKLFPLHKTKMKKWKPIHSKINKYFDEYEGYVSSHDSYRVDDKELEKLSKRIRGEINGN